MVDTQTIAAATKPASGRLWRIRVMRAGLSANGNYYPDASLRAAVPLFEGVRVFVKSDEDHLRGVGKDVRNLFGRLVSPAYVDGAGPDQGHIEADLELIEPDGAMGRMVYSAWKRGMGNLFGFSIDAAAKIERRQIEGRLVKAATEFRAVKSVDLIVEPGAGGEVMNLIEAVKGTPMKTPVSHTVIRDLVAASRLPKVSQDRIIADLTAQDEVTEEELREAINRERDYAAALSDSGTIKGLGTDDWQTRGSIDRVIARVTETRDEKVANMLDAFFDPADRSVTSIRECYLEITGDKNFTGLIRNCDQARLREALGTAVFSDVLGNSIARKMVKEYGAPAVYDVWRDAATVVPVADFRTNERVRFGGYGDLPGVEEGAAYQPLTSPTDEKASYAISKRGGTEEVTLEMITNDDVNAIREVPRKMARAAKRTLCKFVMDFLRTNPVIFDGVTLFHASRGNLGSAALDSASVGCRAAGDQGDRPRRTPNEKLGIGPRFRVGARRAGGGRVQPFQARHQPGRRLHSVAEA